MTRVKKKTKGIKTFIIKQGLKFQGYKYCLKDKQTEIETSCLEKGYCDFDGLKEKHERKQMP